MASRGCSASGSIVSTEAAQQTAAVVLAGGSSSRLGYDKRRLRLWGDSGPTLLEHVVATVGALADEVVVVLNDPQHWPELRARLVPDHVPGTGALGGIYSGLASCTTPYALVVACDMPLLSHALLAAMLALPRDYDLLLPRAAACGATRNRLGVETLHAVYGRACLEPMRQALEAGQTRITAFFAHVRVRVLERDFWAAYDPHGRSFLNINTPEQLQAARQWLAGEASFEEA